MLRIMGEIDIYTVPELHPSNQKVASLSARIVPPSALNEANECDFKNWLGDQLDNPDESKGEPSDSETKDVEDVAALLIHQHANETALTNETNRFVLMPVLCERWPIGSKARLKDIAARAGASFGYHFAVSPPQPLLDAADDDALSKAEANPMVEMLPHLKRARKQFASSTGL